ncbi:hypothetical protein JL721_7555 [Aureococcus anophagefferens]|nr:hypothetical protein JL721_7555 [Aureococcus anophagefferens]
MMARCCLVAALVVSGAHGFALPRPGARAPRGAGVSLRASPSDVAAALGDERLVLNFACFGFYERDCLLELDGDGTCEYSAGMISDGPGEWRVVGGDPDGGESPADAYLEFSQPMTEIYRELYNVPSGTVFWRGRVVPSGGGYAVVDGVAISRPSQASAALKVVLSGGGFQKEGTFTGRLVLPDDDEDDLPQPVSIELFDGGGDAPVAQQAAASASARSSRRRRATRASPRRPIRSRRRRPSPWPSSRNDADAEADFGVGPLRQEAAT